MKVDKQTNIVISVITLYKTNKLYGKLDQENQSLTVSKNSLNMKLECWEHSDKFVPDLVAIISASCC